ncbi:hypothetical protein DPMN_144474 [Dreissena polymorpha]|uniref:Uncharacterized protein n=1 Tax=Dreissena polymorpha TaxID=45954 RepID=A0A9D4GF25_DREPO|nr:hypothetical protein DPMN_144474 [Dreissena polymorpha]
MARFQFRIRITKLTNSKTGVLVAQNMTFRMVTCVENGQYQLTASNTYSNDSSMINITIAKFEEHILGCPQPTFTWTHGNLSYSTGTKNISYTANTVYVSSFKDFGVYKLEIENNAGMYRTYFTLLADVWRVELIKVHLHMKFQSCKWKHFDFRANKHDAYGGRLTADG